MDPWTKEAMQALLLVPRTPEQAHDAGYDSVVHGANATNCHFSYFATPELMEAWTQGRRLAESQHSTPK